MTGSVKIFQTNDDGDICFINGQAVQTTGLDSMVYLSLFGGNEDDDGLQDNNKQWWGNIDEPDPASQYRSETQFLLKSLPATVGNLARVRKTVARDLKWILDNRIASSINVTVTLTDINKLNISGTIRAVGEETDFNFAVNWKEST